jgi:hypothetical protein
MGRGRQKAKQTKIARKLKYLTTDTDYDELAKELSSQEASAEREASAVGEEFGPIESVSSHTGDEHSIPGVDDDLDDYAKWAAQAAAKATASEMPAAPVARHRHIPIPVPSALKPKLEKVKAHPKSEAAKESGSGSDSKPAAKRAAKTAKASSEAKTPAKKRSSAATKTKTAAKSKAKSTAK